MPFNPLPTVTVDTPATADWANQIKSNQDFLYGMLSTAVSAVGGRLTLQSGVPVPSIDLHNQSTLYYTPFIHNRIPVWDGSRWQPTEFDELSLALSGLSGDTNYDVFVEDDGGLEMNLTAWTSNTVRFVTLATVNGFLVDQANPERLFVGSFRTLSGTSNTSDTSLLRFVNNFYNRVHRPFSALATNLNGTISGTEVELNTAFRTQWIATGAQDTFVHLFFNASFYQSSSWYNNIYFYETTGSQVLGSRAYIGDQDITANHGGPLTVQYAGYSGRGWRRAQVRGYADAGAGHSWSYRIGGFPAGTQGYVMG